MSVNRAWQGRRFKTPEYKKYREDITFLMPPIEDFPKPPFEVYYEFGVSSKNADWDNPCKLLQDALQERYGFNDRHIVKAVIKKEYVKKGDEYIKFSINHIDYD
jgi:Holliday junction resolvase RusA-like endonuclease